MLQLLPQSLLLLQLLLLHLLLKLFFAAGYGVFVAAFAAEVVVVVVAVEYGFVVVMFVVVVDEYVLVSAFSNDLSTVRFKVQFFSSDPSKQSLIPSQYHFSEIQKLFLQRN